jgi:hypothetical protein
MEQIHHLHFAWSDFFSGSPEKTFSQERITSRQTPSQSSVYVLNCLFIQITLTSDNGGALSCTSASYFFVESSSFFSCKTSNGLGGAIYFSNSNCYQSVLYKVCGNDCISTYTSTSNGQFAYILINNVASSKNCVNYSSIARCVSESTNTYRMLNLYYGKIYCPSINVSVNECGIHSGIDTTSYPDSSSVCCSLTYSTIANNTARVQVCNAFYNGAKCEIRCCNILRNSQYTTNHGTFYVSAILTIRDSCILENTASRIFAGSSSGTTTLINCTIDKTTNNGYLTIQNTATKSFIHGLNHMSTQNCHAAYDAAGYLTAVPHVSTNIINCPTYKKDQARIGDLFRLIYVFMVTFIHPNPSVYC